MPGHTSAYLRVEFEERFYREFARSNITDMANSQKSFPSVKSITLRKNLASSLVQVFMKYRPSLEIRNFCPLFDPVSAVEISDTPFCASGEDSGTRI